MARRMPLAKLLATRHPSLDAAAVLAAGRVQVDGSVVTNLAALVDPGCRLVVTPDRVLKGERKLGAALDALGTSPVPVVVDGAVCVDVGASTGGFTSALLSRGAARVYAVDAGFGQLVGSLRQDPRVHCLETVNAAALSPSSVPEVVDVVTVDVSYTPLAVLVPQLTAGLASVLSPACTLVALVKPMFELALGSLPRDDASVDEAVARASSGLASCGWSVVRSFRSALLGNNGAVEWWLVARRSAGATPPRGVRRTT